MHTFLFTDIEGSTRLWERHPDVMSAAVARHERILRDAIEVRGGSVFNTAGDSVCAVFPSPHLAVAAAIEGQRALLAEPWSAFAPQLQISVRIALDAGEAQAAGGNYLGPALNQLHRLMKTGHGGQILCGAAVADSISAGSEIELRYLGSHALRDVASEIRIYQILAPGLLDAFPRLIVDRPSSTRLPYHPATMIGRDAELRRIGAKLRSHAARVVSLLGPGGVGKTTLAIALARQVDDAFPDGVHFIDLSAVHDGALVAPTLARTLEIEDPLLTPEDALVAGLQTRVLLLVLDNCEQVVNEVARVVARLIGETPSISVLATSRVPLRIAAEREERIEPLPLPTQSADADENPAVQLFREHACQVNPHFTLNDTARPAVVDICRMVDGLPLAIELAAAWVRILDPATLRDRMAQGAPLLRSDARDRPERHRTLTSTIDWSYQLLDPATQSAFGRLSVFQGGIPLDGALAVLQADERATFIEALEQLDLLVQANLLQPPVQTSDGPRYHMLQTIQEFALGTLSSKERIAASRAHAAYFAAMTASAATHYRDPEAAIWLGRLDANIDNVRTACSWLASDESDALTTSLELTTNLWEYFDLRNQHAEARAVLTAALDATSPQPDVLRARALALVGHTWLGDHEQAETFYRRSIDMVQGLPDAAPPFDAITGLLTVALNRGDFATAIARARDFLDHARKSGRADIVAQALLNLGQVLGEVNDSDTAVACWAESQSICAMLGDSVGLAWIRGAEGRLRFGQGQYAESESLFLQAIAALEVVGERQMTAFCQLDVAKIAALREDKSLAHSYLLRAVDAIATSGSATNTWEAIKTGAIVLTLALEQPEIALALFQAAENWSRSVGAGESTPRRALFEETWRAASMRASDFSESPVDVPISLREAMELLQRTLRTSTGTRDQSLDLAAPA